jgi:hypothetical protein
MNDFVIENGIPIPVLDRVRSGASYLDDNMTARDVAKQTGPKKPSQPADDKHHAATIAATSMWLSVESSCAKSHVATITKDLALPEGGGSTQECLSHRG